MAKHSLDIAAFKSVSITMIPLLVYSILDSFERLDSETFFSALLFLFLTVVPYYTISALGWMTWGLLTVMIAKKYSFHLPSSIFFSALLFFALLSSIAGVASAAPLSGVVFIQALAFIWYGRPWSAN